MHRIGSPLFAFAAALFVWSSSSPALAQAYPTRPVMIVAPAAPGGLYGNLAKLVGDRLQVRLGQPFIVEHKPGAGTAVGAAYVARAEPDGYTLLIAATPTLAVQPHILKKQLYDSAKDFTPIAMLGVSPVVLVVSATLPITSIADLVRLAKEKPGVLTYASNGPGSVLHLAGEMLQNQLKLKLIHVPYKGVAPALTDIAAGHVAMMFSPLEVARPLSDAGKVRMIGVSSRERIDAIPEVPPLTETGVPGFDVKAWFMLVGPGNLPPAIVEKLHREVSILTTEPDVVKMLVQQGTVPVKSQSPAELAKFVVSEVAAWGQVVKGAGLAQSE